MTGKVARKIDSPFRVSIESTVPVLGSGAEYPCLASCIRTAMSTAGRLDTADRSGPTHVSSRCGFRMLRCRDDLPFSRVDLGPHSVEVQRTGARGLHDRAYTVGDVDVVLGSVLVRGCELGFPVS